MHIGPKGGHRTALYVKLRVDRLVYISVVDEQHKPISVRSGLVDYYSTYFHAKRSF